MHAKKRIIISICVLIALLALIVFICITLAPLIAQILENAGDNAQTIRYVEQYGSKGALLLGGLSMLQVVLIVIPGPAVQLLTGMCYGVWNGMLIFIAGSVAGNIIVFSAARLFGNALSPFLEKIRQRRQKQGKFNIYKLKDIIQGIKHPGRLGFLLYLIPVLPNGILAYALAKSRISFPHFLLALGCSSFPSSLLWNWLGKLISGGDILATIILATIIAIATAVIIRNRKKLLEKARAMSD